MLRIGHRGAKGYIAENTLASFQKALDLVCDGIELDVHLSLDEQVMVIHDATIDRTTVDRVFVANLSATTLKHLGVSTLNEVLNLIDKRCFVNIEIKDENATKFVLSIIQKYCLEHNWDENLFQISSFKWSILQDIFFKNSSIALGVLTDKSIDEAIVFAKKIKAHSINPYYKLLDKEKVTLMHKNKFKIFAWTVNEADAIETMKLLGVDGVISDYPDRVY